MVRALLDAWRRFWFTPATATNLGASRLMFFLGLTLFYLPHDFSGWGDVAPALLQPIWLFDRFDIPVLSAAALNIIQVIWKIALLCACIGLFTRASMLVV